VFEQACGRRILRRGISLQARSNMLELNGALSYYMAFKHADSFRIGVLKDKRKGKSHEKN
jgi:hypothetical protein